MENADVMNLSLEAKQGLIKFFDEKLGKKGMVYMGGGGCSDSCPPDFAPCCCGCSGA